MVSFTPGILSIPPFTMESGRSAPPCPKKRRLSTYVLSGVPLKSARNTSGGSQHISSGIEDDGLSSGGSNLGPTNQKLADRVKADVAKFHAENPSYTGPVPADLVTASGSGLDPDISPEAAEAQVARVAAARGMTVETVRAVVAANTQQRQLGILGEPRVNVLNVNLALDQTGPGKK